METPAPNQRRKTRATKKTTERGGSLGESEAEEKTEAQGGDGTNGKGDERKRVRGGEGKGRSERKRRKRRRQRRSGEESTTRVLGAREGRTQSELVLPRCNSIARLLPSFLNVCLRTATAFAIQTWNAGSSSAPSSGNRKLREEKKR